MSVGKRRDGQRFFRKRIRLPDGRKVRVFAVPGSYGLPNTIAGAEEAGRRRIGEMLDGRIVHRDVSPSKSMTLAEFEPIYMEHSDGKNEYSTTKAKRQILRDHIRPAFGPVPLDQITFARIEDLKHRLLRDKPQGAGVGHKTANNILTVLRRLLAVAVKRGELAAIPEFEWLLVPAAGFDFLSFEESEALIAAAEIDWRAMIAVGIKCGLRQGELLGLRWTDVDLKNGRITVRQSIVRGRVKGTKSRRAREVALGTDVALDLARHRHLRGPYVFCDDLGAPLTNGECKHPLYRSCATAGLRRIGWHVLRHTFGSQLAMQGATPSAIQKLMGHATLRMTERYMHLSPNVARDAVKLLDRSAHPVPNSGTMEMKSRDSK